MNVSLSTIGNLFRTAYNAVVPTSYYKPSFTAGTTVCSKFIGHNDTPRFSGDSLYSTECSGVPLLIERISYGQYKLNNSNNPASAVFEHDKLGSPHYEVRVTSTGLNDNYQSGKSVPRDSLIHFPVQTIEERFISQERYRSDVMGS